MAAEVTAGTHRSPRFPFVPGCCAPAHWYPRWRLHRLKIVQRCKVPRCQPHGRSGRQRKNLLRRHGESGPHNAPTGWEAAHPVSGSRQFVLKMHRRRNLACDYCYVYTSAGWSPVIGWARVRIACNLCVLFGCCAGPVFDGWVGVLSSSQWIVRIARFLQRFGLWFG